MPARPRAQAFLALLHHFLEDRTFINDFDSPGKRILSPPIQLVRDPPAQKENVDTPNELQFAREMKAVRDGVVKTVPAIQKKEEEAREKLQKQAEKEQAVQAGAPFSSLSLTLLEKCADCRA
jgi:Ino eighty subunit 1